MIISLFTAGLKLRLPVSDRRWRAAVLLATVAIVLTVSGVAAFALAAVGLPLGAALLLGAILAPTDPVLASDVQVEHHELAVVLVVGAMLADIELPWLGMLMALALFVVIRPVATLVTLWRLPMSPPQRAFIAWFGVRGVGSIYYLAYALSHGVSAPSAQMLADITLVVVAASVVLRCLGDAADATVLSPYA